MGWRLFENNRKRRVASGLIVEIFVVLISFGVYAGCEGDCMKCHPILEGNKDHEILKTCVTCHNSQTKKNLYTFKADDGGCGANCFKCHNVWPKDGNHASLETCINCHSQGG